MSAAGRALIKALESPDDWTANRHTIKHTPTGMEFWTANGGFFFDGWEPDDIRKSIGFLERHWLRFKARKVRAKFDKTKAARLVAERFAEASK